MQYKDYLGSLMGLGITREKIGDILIGETGAQVIVLRETLPILLAQWEKAGRYPVTLTPLPLDQLAPTPGETKEVRATVASVRLDTVVLYLRIKLLSLRLLAIAQYPENSESLLDFVTCILYQNSL